MTVTAFLKDPVLYTKNQIDSHNHILNFVIVITELVTEPCTLCNPVGSNHTVTRD